MSPVYEFSMYSPAEKTKLAGIEDGAQINIGEEYTTPEKTKLTGIEPGAEVNVGETYTLGEATKLAGVEDGAKDDQTPAEIVIDLEGLADAARLSADAVKDGTTGAIPTITQKAKIDSAIISNPVPVTEEKITQLDFVIAGNKLKATTVP